MYGRVRAQCTSEGVVAWAFGGHPVVFPARSGPRNQQAARECLQERANAVPVSDQVARRRAANGAGWGAEPGSVSLRQDPPIRAQSSCPSRPTPQNPPPSIPCPRIKKNAAAGNWEAHDRQCTDGGRIQHRSPSQTLSIRSPAYCRVFCAQIGFGSGSRQFGSGSRV